jgi:hypothetical protein
MRKDKMVTRSIIILLFSFNLSYAQSDSVFTFIVDSNKISFPVPSDIYVNLIDFQKFISSVEHKNIFDEVLVFDLTGDGIKDTLFNNITLFGDDCKIVSYISSNSEILFTDTLIISSDIGNYDNIWGSDELFKKLLPYSNLYNGYLNKLVYHDLSKEDVADKLNIYLSWETEKNKEYGLNNSQIAIKNNEIRNYVENYKGKFIHNLSISDYDTYIYFPKENKFVLFYSP